jgi:hypothetical protein
MTQYGWLASLGNSLFKYAAQPMATEYRMTCTTPDGYFDKLERYPRKGPCRAA